MSRPRWEYLVVGSDSMVGGALLKQLRQTGLSASGTTRRSDKVGEECHYLDLSGNLRTWLPPGPVEVAILCAGVTRLRDCRQRPEESRKINVDGITQIARSLHDAGTFVIYLSTNQVFDGSIPFRSTRDATCPVTEYGHQKAEAERRMRDSATADSIVRLTKVIGPYNALFAGWAQALRHGQAIRPYSDVTLAPVPLSSVIRVLLRIATQRADGIHHVSGERDITYAEAARIGAQILGAGDHLIQPLRAAEAEAEASAEPPPTHTTLDVSELKSRMGVVPPEVRWTVETAFVRPHLLAET